MKIKSRKKEVELKSLLCGSKNQFESFYSLVDIVVQLREYERNEHET